MNSEEKFKKSLQEKIESKEFAFDEKEWEKAANIIDVSKKGNNKGFIYILTIALVLLLGYLSLNFNSNVFSPSKDLSASLNAEPKNENQELPKTENSKPIQNAIIKTQNKNSKNSDSGKLNSTHSHSTLKSSGLAKETEDAPLPAESGSIEKTKGSTKEMADSSSTQASGIEPEISESNHSPLLTSNSSIEKNTSEYIPLVSPVLNETRASSSNSKNSDTISQKENPDLLYGKIPEPLIKEENSLKVILMTDNNLTLSQTLVSDTGSKRIIPSTSIHNILTFEVGTAYLFGWKNEEGRDANGFNPLIGINYLSNILHKYWFSFGIQYNSVRNLNYSSKTSKVTHYKLGEESDVTKITPTTLHYLSFPFKLQYQPNEKNSFGAAYTINYLINVESKVETYTQKNFSTENYQSYTASGYTEGFRLFSSQLGLFYRHQLMKDLCLNTELVFGLNDIKENSFFNSNSIERNSGIKLTLTYNLFKK